jgi:hypothetical protein
MADQVFTDSQDNPALANVQDYIMDCRVLLQDTTIPYRYDDNSLLFAMNTMLLEMRRLRPDIFLYNPMYRRQMPAFTVVDDTLIDIEDQFRLALVYGICSHALARDQEDVQDERAATFLATFTTLLIGTRMPPVAGGGTPGGQKQ